MVYNVLALAIIPDVVRGRLHLSVRPGKSKQSKLQGRRNREVEVWQVLEQRSYVLARGGVSYTR